MNQMIPSFVFKRRAWMAIRPWLQVLVIIGLLAVLPTLLYDAASTLLSDDLAAAVEGPARDVLEFASQPIPESFGPEEEAALLQEAEAVSNAFMTAVGSFFREKGWILLALGVMQLLLTPMFMTPMYGGLLDALRKRDLTLAGCLGYLGLSGRALLLEGWMFLRISAWMLPGMALMLGSFFVPLLQPLRAVGMIAAMVLGVRAALHYALAPVVLVDKPEISINGCIRASWQVMCTRKMEYFMLHVSFIGWQLLVSLISMLQVNVVMTAVCLTLTMMANLLLTLYMNGAVAAFWDAYGVRRENPAEAMNTESHPDEPGDELN